MTNSDFHRSAGSGDEPRGPHPIVPLLAGLCFLAAFGIIALTIAGIQ